MQLPYAKKSLGQHWLTDESALSSIADAADISSTDVVLEIGPGVGTLTKLLVKRAHQVVAVEFDEALAAKLPKLMKAPNLEVVKCDILSYDLTTLPAGYKVVANIPYYLTSKLIRVLSESVNPPQCAVLLVQKEVAQRVAAAPGSLSLLAVTAQYYWQVSLGAQVPAKMFTPPPKVDSQVLIMHKRAEPLFEDINAQDYFHLVRAGFSARRKTLSNSLSAGLHITKPEADDLLIRAGIKPTTRAQALSLEQWNNLYQVVELMKTLDVLTLNK